jgi:plasmid stability protein
MVILYVENVPDDLYEALRKRAKNQRRSIAAEVLCLLESNVPTAKALQRRRALDYLQKERSANLARFGAVSSESVTPVATSPATPRLRDATEIRSWLDALAQFSDKIPALPDSISRQWLYLEHD